MGNSTCIFAGAASGNQQVLDAAKCLLVGIESTQDHAVAVQSGAVRHGARDGFRLLEALLLQLHGMTN